MGHYDDCREAYAEVKADEARGTTTSFPKKAPVVPPTTKKPKVIKDNKFMVLSHNPNYYSFAIVSNEPVEYEKALDVARESASKNIGYEYIVVEFKSLVKPFIKTDVVEF